MDSLNEANGIMSEKPIVELDVPFAALQEVANVQLVMAIDA